MTQKQPTEGDLRVWNTINFSDMKYYPVGGIQHAKNLIDAMAQSQLLESYITDNAFGLEVYEDGEWCEWMSAYGDSIDEYEVETEEA